MVDKTRRTAFTCQQCGHASPRWLGVCPACSTWGSLVEEIVTDPRARTAAKGRPSGAAAPYPLTAVRTQGSLRRSTGIGELDRVLGGGIVQGSVILVGGDPGIGKSTLTLQACSALARQGLVVLYVAGEESPEQVRLRADRLGLDDAGVLILPETNAEAVIEQIDAVRPAVVVVDSIQTLHTATLASAPGSVGQVRESAALLTTHCKASGTACVLIGHVTKEGALAGPRVLEHLVDTVLYFEGDGAHALRVLRAVKNRFGSTNEVGVFEMAESGLVEVQNPSAAFLAERPAGAPGSAVLATLEGSRPGAGRDPGARVALGPGHAATDRDRGRSRPRRAAARRAGEAPPHAAPRSGRVPERRRRPARRRAGRRPRRRGGGGVERTRPSAARRRRRCGARSVSPARCARHARAEARVREAARQGFRRCILPAGNVRGLPATPGLRAQGVAALDQLFDALDLA